MKISKQITNRESLSLDRYLQEIGKYDLLTAEDEVKLTRAIKEGYDMPVDTVEYKRAKRALDKLIKGNLRFVVSVAKQYQNQGLTLGDLINEGNLGLIKAAKRFDETRGFKFISYAVWWIRQSILQALAEQSRIVRLPLNRVGTLNKISKAYSQLEQEYERDPNTKELANLLDMDSQDVADTLKIAGRHVSVDAPFAQGDDNRLLDVLQNDGHMPDHSLNRDSLTLEVERSLSVLAPREADVIRSYFGIGMDNPLTLEEIGEKFKLTRERVRQIKEKAIRRLEPQGSVTLEDFEPTPKQTWESLGAEAVFGKFNGGINNPDKTGANTTAKVGSFTKGTSKLGGLKALLPSSFTLATFPQVNLQVWAPAGAKSITMKLVSVVEGPKEINRPIAETGKWVDVSFNFDNVKAIKDFERVEIVFDPNLESTATWYFDNLTQTKATVDPCEGTVANVNVIDDFDCQRNAKSILLTDNPVFEVLRNPFPGGINPNANDKVAKYVDPAGAGKEWSIVLWDMGKEIDLSSFNTLAVKIYASKAVPVLFKLEGGTKAFEVKVDIKAADLNKWVEYQIDFKAAAGSKNSKFGIFFNAGNASAEGDTYYIDDVEWRREPYTACISSFETPADNLGKWQYFANGALDGKQVDIVVDNPKKSGINTSNKVAEFIEDPGGNIFAGMFNNGLPAQVFMKTNKKITMKVLMDHAAEVVFKLENAAIGLNTGDTKVKYTTPNEWQTLTWDFSGIPLADNTIATVLAIIMDFDNTPTTTKKYYFDDIAIGNANCSPATPVNSLQLDALAIYPNPASDELTVDNAASLFRYEIFNAVGQRVGTYVATGQAAVTIPLTGLDRGMYLLAGYDRQGVLRANARFIKQ